MALLVCARHNLEEWIRTVANQLEERGVPIPAEEVEADVAPFTSHSNSSSADLFKRAKEHLVDGYARPLVAVPHPSFLDHGEGCWAFDVDGNGRIDFTNNFGALAHGYAHPQIVEAICHQAGLSICSTMPTALEAELAGILAERIPSIEQVRFSNTGTDAVMLAIKMARALTGRSKIAKIEGGYHGQYELTESSFQPSPETWGNAARPNTVPRNEGTPDYMLEQLVVVPCNDLEATRALLNEHKDEIAAFILCPMQVQLGYGKPSPAYVKMLRAETERLGIVLIFDEVVALRNGLHGTQGKLGILPDITVMGKFIGGGLPIGAVGGPKDMMSVFKVSGDGPRVLHSGTFSANALSLAAGVVAMRLLTPDVYDRFDTLSDRLCAGFSSIFDKHGIEARLEQYSAGSVKVVFGSDPIENWRDLHAYFQKHLHTKTIPLQKALLQHGVMANRLSFIISTPMDEAAIDFTIRAFDAAVAQCVPELLDEGIVQTENATVRSKNSLM